MIWISKAAISKQNVFVVRSVYRGLGLGRAHCAVMCSKEREGMALMRTGEQSTKMLFLTNLSGTPGVHNTNSRYSSHERDGEVGNALSKQFNIGIMPVTTHAIGDYC